MSYMYHYVEIIYLCIKVSHLKDVTCPEGDCRVEVVTQSLQLPRTLGLGVTVLRVAAQRVILLVVLRVWSEQGEMSKYTR